MIVSIKNHSPTEIYIKDNNFPNYVLIIEKFNKNKTCKVHLYCKDNDTIYYNIKLLKKYTSYSDSKIKLSFYTSCQQQIYDIAKQILHELYNHVTFKEHKNIFYRYNKRVKQYFPIFIYHLSFKKLLTPHKFVVLYNSDKLANFKKIYKEINTYEVYEFMKRNKWAVRAFMGWLFRMGFLFRFWKIKKYKLLFDNVDYIYMLKYGKIDSTFCKEVTYKPTYIISFRSNKFGNIIKIKELQNFISKTKVYSLPGITSIALEYNPNGQKSNINISNIYDAFKQNNEFFFKFNFNKIVNIINQLLTNKTFVNTYADRISEIINYCITICSNEPKLEKYYKTKLMYMKLKIL